MASNAPRILILFGAGDAIRLRLYCFPFAAGNPYLFRDWAGRLGAGVQVVGVQLPGHGGRLMQPPLTSVEAMAAEACAALDDSTPFAFYGHSLGALIAFEVARLLRREGRRQPSQLFAGGARPPHIRPAESPLHRLDDAEFLSVFQQRYAGIPLPILDQPEMLELFIPPLRADFTAFESYVCRPEPQLDCPIDAFCGDRDPLVKPNAVAEWARHTRAGFELHVVAGNHFFLEESRGELLAVLKSKLAEK